MYDSDSFRGMIGSLTDSTFNSIGKKLIPPKLAKTDSRKPKGKADTELPVFCLGNCTEVRSLSTWGQTGLGSSPSTALTGRGISGLQALTVSTCERTMPLGPTSRGAVRVQWRCTWLRAHWLERGKESAHLSCPQQCLPCIKHLPFLSLCLWVPLLLDHRCSSFIKVEYWSLYNIINNMIYTSLGKE